jgi:hypothetical protein
MSVRKPQSSRNDLTIRKFFSMMESSAPDALRYLTEDATWSSFLQGKLNRSQALDSATAIQNQLATRLEIDVRILGEEGDQVTAETELSCKLKNGTAYKNGYEYSFRLREGLIYEVQERCKDAKLAEQVWKSILSGAS